MPWQCASLSEGGMISSCSGRSRTSSRRYPNISSAFRLNSMTRPAASMVMRASRFASTIAADMATASPYSPSAGRLGRGITVTMNPAPCDSGAFSIVTTSGTLRPSLPAPTRYRGVPDAPIAGASFRPLESAGPALSPSAGKSSASCVPRRLSVLRVNSRLVASSA